MKLFAIALLVLTVMGNRHTTQHFLGRQEGNGTAADNGDQEERKGDCGEGEGKGGKGDDKMDEFACEHECEDFMESMEDINWEVCGDCMMNTCVAECEMCDWEDENDPCWEGCMACWDPENCRAGTDMGENEEWATEAEAMDCWVESNPCAVQCEGMEAPSEGCLVCLDNNGYMEHNMINTPMMIKSLNKLVQTAGGEGETTAEEAPREGKADCGEGEGKGGKGDDKMDEFECADQCEDFMESMEDINWEVCGECMMSTCVAECEMCDWEDENDPCWEGCMACWDPENCRAGTDMGENEEWATEAAAGDCWVESNPCAVQCEGMEAPSEGCLVCLDNNGYMEHNMKNALSLNKVFNKLIA